MATSPESEDWGWYIECARGEARYLLGASGDADEGGVRWALQLHRRRSLWDRIRGRNRLLEDDPFAARIGALLAEQTDFHELETQRES